MKHAATLIQKIDIRLQTITLGLVLVCLVAAYMYFLSLSVVHVVMSREYIHAGAEVASQITELEAQFIEAQHSVRREVALQDGFVLAERKTFIAPSDTSLVAIDEG